MSDKYSVGNGPFDLVPLCRASLICVLFLMLENNKKDRCLGTGNKMERWGSKQKGGNTD